MCKALRTKKRQASRNKAMKYLALLIIIIIFRDSASSETIETKLHSAQQDLYNAKYQLAQQKFVAITKEYPSHPAGHFF